MAVAGSLTYDTEIDKSGFEKGLNSLKTSTSSAFSQIKNIVTALGIDKLISATFNVLNNSIDGAISRLDTLNNYPKVMSNLGIASEDAKKSIQKMSDKLSGLPTTLDQGALAVQRFTSKNNDVNKSTDYFLALNNALLAGGASADIQSTALEQLSQSYAKGKPDMVEWRSIQTAMPAQLNQVAQSFGITSDQLGEALRNGKISMDDFMDKIVELNENGTGEFQSFEEQARNSTGGIATSIPVAKTQVLKGVADIISKIDELLKENGLGGISEIISNIGKKAKEVLDWVAEKLPVVVNIIRELIPYLEAAGVIFAGWKIGTAIQSAVKGFQEAQVALSLFKLQSEGATIAQGLFNGTLTLGETLVGLFTGKVTLAELATAGLSKAQAVLNAVMSANPVALVIIAITALIAIFVVLWNKCDWFRNFWIELWNNIKEIFEPIVNSIINFFTNTIPNAIQSFINFFSNFPYNVGYLIGQAIVWFATLPQRIKQHFDESKQKMQEWISNMITMVRNKIPEIINSIRNFFAELPNNMLNIGKNIVEGLWNGIKNAGNWMKQKVGEFANGVLDGMKSALRYTFTINKSKR